MTKAEREEIFMILSSKLEAKDAEELEKIISVHFLEKDKRFWIGHSKHLRKCIIELEQNMSNKRVTLQDVSMEGKQNGLRAVITANENRINLINENIIEILK